MNSSAERAGVRHPARSHDARGPSLRQGLPGRNLRQSQITVSAVRLLSAFALMLTCLMPLQLSAQSDAPSVTSSPINPFGSWQLGEGGTRGRLVSFGGLVLSSDDPDFGGFSALEFLPPNGLLAATDRGHFLNGRIQADETRLTTFTASNFFPIPIDRSALLNRGAATDAEALAIRNGDILLAFEREHRIQRHSSPTARPTTLPVPIALRRPAPLGFGIEAMTTLKNGQLFAIAEKVQRDGGVRAWLINEREERELLVYPFDGSWLTSAATTLPSGNVLIMERRPTIIGFQARLLLLKRSQIVPGAKLSPELLLQFPFATPASDNLEGLTVFETGGRLFLLTLSDDNFQPLQQTRLLMFEWERWDQ